MSGNHNGSLERALRLVDVAAECGARALKIQTYTADTMTLDLSRGEFVVPDDGSSPGAGGHYIRCIRKHNAMGLACRDFREMPGERSGWVQRALRPECRGLPRVAARAVLQDCVVRDVDLPLIRRVAATGKPVIVSTGLATMSEIEDAVEAARNAGCRDLILLKCTSAYPASPRHSNLATIPQMRSIFRCEIGVSDHTPGIGAAVAAAALGATVIEKHLTLSRADGGVDSAFSLEPQEFAQLVTETARAVESIGDVAFGPSDAEIASLKFRRSLYVVRDVRGRRALYP